MSKLVEGGLNLSLLGENQGEKAERGHKSTRKDTHYPILKLAEHILVE